MTTENLTYKEISERLGTQVDSVRKLVRRRRWHKVKGNDGEIRVAVPVDYFPAQSPTQPVTEDIAPPPDQLPDQMGVKELQMRVQHLQEMLDETRQDRDRWHAMAVRPWWKKLAG